MEILTVALGTLNKIPAGILLVIVILAILLFYKTFGESDDP